MEYFRNTISILRIAAVFLAVVAAGGAGAAESQSGITADVLKSVVGVRGTIPMDSGAAQAWGPVREGNGIVIDSSGLVLTVRYLIRRGISAEVIDHDGEVIPAKIIAYDHASNFGLVRADKPLKVKPIRLGDSAAVPDGAEVLAVSHGVGRPAVSVARVLQRFTYAAENEYLIENTFVTVPAHDNFGGAALISLEGRLIGIGSMLVSTATPQGVIPANMWIPINGLKPILGDLIAHGRQKGPGHPWLGIRTSESSGNVVVNRVVAASPGERTGVKAGDIIVGVNGKRVHSVEEYYRTSWATGNAGDVIPLDVLRAASEALKIDRMEVRSIHHRDRYNTPPNR